MLHAPARVELGNSSTQMCHIAFRVEWIRFRREFKWDFAISCDALCKNQKCGGKGQPNLITNLMQAHRQIIIHTHHNILRHLYHFLSYICQMPHSLYHKNSPSHKETQPRAELRFFFHNVQYMYFYFFTSFAVCAVCAAFVCCAMASQTQPPAGATAPRLRALCAS